jgi:hypothetical protein
MSPEQTDNLLVAEIQPQQVWETLQTTQQQSVLQVVVQLCHQIAQLWEREEASDEPHLER